jgi:uncharacterized protein (TIGR02145 family)
MDVRVKSSFDPCPAGYRIPSYTEWEGLINYNSSGTRVIGSPVAVSGKKFGGALFLPAAAYRSYTGTGALEADYRGRGGYYWTTRKLDTDAANYMNHYSSGADFYYGDRGFGMSVRCIAE